MELEQMVSNPDLRDPRLIELSEKALTHTLASTRTMVEILYPDDIRPGMSLDDIAIYFTAVDTGATVATLLKLGWTLEDYEHWVVQLLVLFLDPDGSPKTNRHPRTEKRRPQMRPDVSFYPLLEPRLISEPEVRPRLDHIVMR